MGFETKREIYKHFVEINLGQMLSLPSEELQDVNDSEKRITP